MSAAVTTRRLALSGLVVSLAACAQQGGAGGGSVPAVAANPGGGPPSPAGLGLQPGSDPVFASLLYTQSAFAAPASRIGQNLPYAARLSGMYEYLVAMMWEPRFVAMAAIVQPPLALGRAQLREVLGIGPTLAPDTVIRALAGAAAALDRGDRAAAERALAPAAADPARTLTALGALPAMPAVNNALALTQRAWSVYMDGDMR
jgi:hypothetical protein